MVLTIIDFLKEAATGIVFRLSNAVGSPIHKEVNCWDLVVNDLKVGGVLVERFEEKVCIGIGVNYFWKNPKIPNAGALFNVVQKEESIKEHAIKWAEKVYESMTKNSFSLESYKAKLQTLGKIVEYPEGRGWAEDINENGSLRIKTTEGEIINLTSPLISEVN